MHRRHLLQLLGSSLLASSSALAQQGPLLGVWKAPSGGGGVAPAWNPADKDANIVLSNSNHTATKSGGFAYKGVRSVTSVPSGKVYFEATVSFVLTAIAFLGMANGACDLAQSLGNTADGIGYGSTGNIQSSSSILGVQSTYTTGDIVQVAYNFATHVAWFGLNGTFGGDPAAGTGGFFFNGGTPLFACGTCTIDNTSMTLTAPVYPVPAGFTALT